MNKLFKLIFLITVLITLKATCANDNVNDSEKKLIQEVAGIGHMIPSFIPAKCTCKNQQKHYPFACALEKEKMRKKWKKSEVGKLYIEKKRKAQNAANQCSCDGLFNATNELIKAADTNNRWGEVGDYDLYMCKEIFRNTIHKCQANGKPVVTTFLSLLNPDIFKPDLDPKQKNPADQ